MQLIVLPQAAKALRKMPKRDAAALERKLSTFAADPFGDHPWAKTLQGIDGVRVRHGDWRAVCEIRRQILTVIVVKVGNRKEVYK